MNERLTRQKDDHQQDIKRLTQENERLSHANDALNERLTRQNDVYQHEVERLFRTIDVLHERLRRRQNENYQQDVKRLFQADEELNERNAALEQRVERLEAVTSRQKTALNPSPELDIRSQFTAFACTLDNVTIS